MMSKEQYLLMKLAEESIEVAHRALKAMQFGLEEKQPGFPNNKQRLQGELIDFIARLEALKNAGIDLSGINDADERVAQKLESSKYYEDISRSLGKLE